MTTFTIPLRTLPKILLALLPPGTNLSESREEFFHILHEAYLKQHAEMARGRRLNDLHTLQALLPFGTDLSLNINAPIDNFGNTALHCAASPISSPSERLFYCSRNRFRDKTSPAAIFPDNGFPPDLELINALLALGADPNCINTAGYTPTMIRNCNSSTSVPSQAIARLIRAGADLTRRDPNGLTLLDATMLGSCYTNHNLSYRRYKDRDELLPRPEYANREHMEVLIMELDFSRGLPDPATLSASYPLLDRTLGIHYDLSYESLAPIAMKIFLDHRNNVQRAKSAAEVLTGVTSKEVHGEFTKDLSAIVASYIGSAPSLKWYAQYSGIVRPQKFWSNLMIFGRQLYSMSFERLLDETAAAAAAAARLESAAAVGSTYLPSGGPKVEALLQPLPLQDEPASNNAPKIT